MIIIAHRGDSAHAPENTLSAFRQAKEKGADWVEFDVVLTADFIPVVFHDERLNRTTNGSGFIGQYKYQDLLKLDAGSWFDPQFKGEAIPSLEAVLKLLSTLNLMANIEIKPSTKALAQETTKAALAVIKKHWPEKKPLPLISSFNMQSLNEFRTLAPEYPLGLLPSFWQFNSIRKAKQLSCSHIHVHYQKLNQAKINDLHKQGFKVFAYTVNQPDPIKKLRSWGIDGIFTDDIERVLKSL